MNRIKGELTNRLTWKVTNFFDLPSERGYFLESPRFPLADGTWCLRMYPNGSQKNQTVSFIVIHLVRLVSSVVEHELSFVAGINGRSGKEYTSKTCQHCFNDDNKYSMGIRFSRSCIEEWRDKYVPCDMLTVFCELHLTKSSDGEMPKIDLGENSSMICEESLRKAEEQQESRSYLLRPAVSVRNMSHTKGELSGRPTVTWKIPEFFDLPSEEDYVMSSPQFQFAGATWCLRMQPNFSPKDQPGPFIAIRLVRLASSVVEHELSFVVGFIGSSGKEYKSSKCQYCFNDDKKNSDELKFSRLKLGISDEYVPGGTLTVLLEFCLTKSSCGGMPKIDLGENQSIVWGESLRKAEEQEESRRVLKKLQSDYKKLLQSGEESDVCLVVSGKEFRAHRNILRARSPVFDAMFSHDTQEKRSGRVVIDDLDPDSFHHFLEHVYTERVEALSGENAFGLYTAADKYDVQALKSVCLEYMRRTLSVDSFCDVMTLALRYHEKELLDLAVWFFKKNVGAIVLTVKWQVFMSGNSTHANELLVKAFSHGNNQQ